jgi:fluoride exporter
MMLLWVMIAGGLGSGARYLVGRSALATFGGSFPYGTLIVNLVGCFALGIVVQIASSGEWSPELRATIAVGFLGGFTTYSSFNQETLMLVSSGAIGAAGLNVALTLAGGLAAATLGMFAARMLQS